LVMGALLFGCGERRMQVGDTMKGGTGASAKSTDDWRSRGLLALDKLR
jgi:hypothetical protein